MYSENNVEINKQLNTPISNTYEITAFGLGYRLSITWSNSIAI